MLEHLPLPEIQNQNMRIGFDAKRAFNNTSGLGNYSRFVLTSLFRLFPENEYCLFTPKTSSQFYNFYPAAAQVQTVQPASFNKLFPAYWRSFNLNADLKKNNIELFHGLSNELPLTLKKAGVKSVVTIHDLIFLRFPELYKPLDRLIYRQKFEYACRTANKIIAISEQTKQDIIHFFGTNQAKIEVIYQDCDAFFHEPVAEELLQKIKQQYALPEDYILCVGTLEPRKNQLLLLKAWHQANVKADLVFVGRETVYKQALTTYISENKLENRVRFLPYIPFQELPAIYRLASLFVYPSIFEGFGIPILEALNCEVPVITSTGSCFAEAGGNAAVYVEPHNLPALTEAIQKISTDSAKKQEMKQLGLQHAQNFHPEKTITQLHNLYKELTGN